MEVSDDIFNKLNDAIENATYKDPVFGLLFSRFKIGKDTASTEHGTLATDCDKIFWNPDFVNTLTNNQIEAVLYHELLHCLGLTGPKGHRLETFIKHGDDRYPLTKELLEQQRSTIANWAADYEINSAVKGLGFDLPSDVLYSENVTGLNLDEILDLVLKDTVYPKSEKELAKAIENIDMPNIKKDFESIPKGSIVIFPPAL